MNNLPGCHGHAVPAPVEIVKATIKAPSQMNHYINAEWKVIVVVYYKLFDIFYLFI